MKISVIGAGAFGFSMSKRLSSKGVNEVWVWAESQEKVDEYESSGKISVVLGGHPLPKGLKMTASMKDAVEGASIVFILTTSRFVASVCENLAPHIDDSTIVVVGTKGACPDGSLPAMAAMRVLGRDVAAIAGPGFAIDIIEDVPVGFTFATRHPEELETVKEAFAQDPHVTLDLSDDVMGIELCSCIKNAAALCCGALYGAGYPITTQCLFLQRMMGDLRSMLEMLDGGSGDTSTSLAGLGDLILTCFSPKSRNGSFGRIVGEHGFDSAEAKSYLESNTVEGLTVVGQWNDMSEKLGIQSDFMDIATQVFSDSGDVNQLVGYILK
ncbi:MAG: NAD(P)H-dependent glycerol-3-phosphate dehydrogenase [Coriobacteriales bacterium]|jgi:glycerol-3-phosphate dehydrogenase (NAD(P)+)